MRTNSVPKGISRVRRASRVRPIERQELKKKKVEATKKVATNYSYEDKLKEPIKSDYLPVKRCLTFCQPAG